MWMSGLMPGGKLIKKGPSFPVRMQWEKPPPGVMKINVDGSCSGNGVISAGGVLRNHIGCWQGGFYANLGSGDILQAEIWGILYGLQLALRYDVKNVEVESDSNSVIDLILNSDASNHPLGSMIMNCRSLRASFTECSFKHVHREKNVVADHLAKASLSKPQGVTWLVDAPYVVTKLILEDIAGIARLRMLPHPVQPICDTFVTVVPEENVFVNNIDEHSMAYNQCPDYGNPTRLPGLGRILQQEEAPTVINAECVPEVVFAAPNVTCRDEPYADCSRSMEASSSHVMLSMARGDAVVVRPRTFPTPMPFISSNLINNHRLDAPPNADMGDCSGMLSQEDQIADTEGTLCMQNGSLADDNSNMFPSSYD